MSLNTLTLDAEQKQYVHRRPSTDAERMDYLEYLCEDRFTVIAVNCDDEEKPSLVQLIARTGELDVAAYEGYPFSTALDRAIHHVESISWMRAEITGHRLEVTSFFVGDHGEPLGSLVSMEEFMRLEQYRRRYQS